MKNSATKKILFIILFLGFTLRIIWIFSVSPKILESDPYYYDRTAKVILNGEGYHNGNKELFAYRPPFYPYFLAGIYGIFGHKLTIVKIIQAILSIATCAMVYMLVKKLLDKRSALFAAAIFSFYPQFIRYTGELWVESLFLLFFMLSLGSLYDFMDKPTWRNGLISGFWWGLSALTREISLLFMVPMAIWMFIYLPGKNRIKVFLKYYGILLLSFCLTISPWIIRNYIIFKKFIPISTNGGINFYMGNNPDANGTFLWRLPKGLEWPDHKKTSDRKILNSMEITICERGYSDGIKFILDNPQKALSLGIKKVFYLWRPPYFNMDIKNINADFIFRVWWLIFDTFLFLCLFPVIYLLFKRCQSKTLLLFLWLIHITIITAFTYYDTRYRLPLVPVLIIFSAMVFKIIKEKLPIYKSNSFIRHEL